ncbi:MAG: hypothetical protein ACXQTW_08590 [Candidatus Methanospirareceae archaeon]
MPAWAVYLLPYIANWAIETYRRILDVTMFFADLCSQISFSLFIAFNSEDDRRIEQYLDAYYCLLLSYTYFCDPELMVIKYYDEINRNPYLRQWFTHTKYLRSLMEAVKRAREEHAEIDDLGEFLEAIYEYSPFSFILAIKQNIIDNAIELLNEKSAHFESILHCDAHKMYAKIKEQIQRYDQHEVKEIKIPRSEELIAQLNPFLPFYFVNLTAHIHAFLSYVDAYERKQIPPLPKQLLRALRADIYLDKQKEAIAHANENLMLTFVFDRADFEARKVKEILIDFAGLKKIKWIWENIRYIEHWEPKEPVWTFGFLEHWEPEEPIWYFGYLEHWEDESVIEG